MHMLKMAECTGFSFDTFTNMMSQLIKVMEMSLMIAIYSRSEWHQSQRNFGRATYLDPPIFVYAM